MEIFVYLYLSVSIMYGVMAEEAFCSKYDFEEKLLEKMVRIEFKMEQMNKSSQESIEKMERAKDAFGTKLDDVDREIGDLIQEIRANFTELKLGVESLIATKVDENINRVSAPRLEFRAVQRPGGVALTQGQPVVFPEVLHNLGGYDPTTGVFTTIGGNGNNRTYIFAVRLCIYSDKYVVPSLVVDGSEMDAFLLDGSTNTECSSANTYLELKQGQKVWLKVKAAPSGNQIHGDSIRWNSFSEIML